MRWPSEAAPTVIRAPWAFSTVMRHGSGVGSARGVEEPDDEYPFFLSTGRIIYHFHTRTKTGRSRELQRAAPEPFVEMAGADAERLRAPSTGPGHELAHHRRVLLEPTPPLRQRYAGTPAEALHAKHLGGDEVVGGEESPQPPWLVAERECVTH